MNPERITISTELAFHIMDHLRINQIYILPYDHPANKGVNENKWEPYREDHALKSAELFRKIIKEMGTQI